MAIQQQQWMMGGSEKLFARPPAFISVLAPLVLQDTTVESDLTVNPGSHPIHPNRVLIVGGSHPNSGNGAVITFELYADSERTIEIEPIGTFFTTGNGPKCSFYVYPFPNGEVAYFSISAANATGGFVGYGAWSAYASKDGVTVASVGSNPAPTVASTASVSSISSGAIASQGAWFFYSFVATVGPVTDATFSSATRNYAVSNYSFANELGPPSGTLNQTVTMSTSRVVRLATMRVQGLLYE